MDDMVTLFHVPLGYRHTTQFLFKRAIRRGSHPDYSSILYLAPTSFKADDAQKIFHELQDGKCYVPPECTTIPRFARRMFATYGKERVLSRALVPFVLSRLSGPERLEGPAEQAGAKGKGFGFSRLSAGFIRDLKQRFPDHDSAALQALCAGMFASLDIPEAVTRVVTEIIGTYGAYREFVGSNGLVDEDDLLVRCPGYVAQKYAAPGDRCTLILDGFYDPSGAERSIIKALILHAGEVLVSLPSEPPFSDLLKEYRDFLRDTSTLREERLDKEVPDRSQPLRYYTYADVEEEVEGMARSIKSSFVSGKIKRLEEITVVFPDLRSYAPMVDRIFRRYGVPASISVRKSLGEMRPFLDLFCLLRSVAEGYPRLHFSQFLSSPYFTALPETLRDWIAPLSLQSGIVAGKEAWLEFIAEGSETLDMNRVPERAEIEKGMKRVFRKLSPLEEIRDGASLARYAEVLGTLADDLGFPGPRTDATTKALSEAFNEILDQIAFIGALTPGSVTLPEFEEALRHLLRTAFLDSEEQGVRVIGFPDAAGLSPRYLYFGGLADGALPQRQEMDYLLPDSAKRRLGLMHLEKFSSLQKYLFTCLVKNCGRHHLSYPLMDGDTLFLPSSFLYGGEELRERIPGIFSQEEYLVAKGNEPLLRQMDEIELLPALLRLPSSLRVTDVDAYRACPRRFFIEKILQLTPSGIKEYEIEAATLGTVIHKIMERLMKEPFTGLDELHRRAEGVVGEVLHEKKMGLYWKGLIKDTFIEMLPELYDRELDIRGEGYISSEVEKNISGEPVKGIKLRGKIDRIDRLGDEVQLIDYKTGTAGLNCTQALSGNEDLQLFLYAAILKSHGYHVSRVGIYSLKDITVKWCPPKRRGRGKGKEEPGRHLDDYISASLQFLESAVARIRKGDFRAKPMNDYVCWNCHEYAFCPYIQQ